MENPFRKLNVKRKQKIILLLVYLLLFIVDHHLIINHYNRYSLCTELLSDD